VSVRICHCHGQHAIGDRRYFLAPCDKRKQTGHSHQPAASQASTDSAWRHPVWLPHSSLRFQRPVGRVTQNDASIARSVYILVLYDTYFALFDGLSAHAPLLSPLVVAVTVHCG